MYSLSNRYFIAGNIWLVLALVLLIGRNVARTSPTMYSYFKVGAWLYPAKYNLLVAAVRAGVPELWWSRNAERHSRRA